MTNEEFETIVSTAKPAVLSAIQRYLHPSFLDSIDDVAQETFIRIYKYLVVQGLDAFDFSKLGNWSYTIAKNESIRFNRKNLREYEKENRALVQRLETRDSFAGGMESAILDRLEYEEILESIPEKYREVLELLGTGKTNSEIAEHLNIKPGTVKSRMFRLRSYINERFGFSASNQE